MKSCLACLLAFASFASAAQSLHEFASAVPIEGTGSEAFYRLTVPQAVYEGVVFADLRDVRVFNGRDETVPHAFRSVGPRSQKPDPVALPLFPLRGPSDARTEDMDLNVVRTGEKVRVLLYARNGKAGEKALLGYLIDASALKAPLAGISVSWGEAGAGRLTSARLEASDDLKTWNTLATDAPLGGVSHAGQRLESNTIEYRNRQAKYLRLLWSDPAQALELGGVRGLPPEQTEQPDRMWKEVAAVPDAAAPGDFTVDLGGRFPVDRLELRLPQENTVVPVQLLTRNDPKDEWMPMSSTVAYRLKQSGREVASPPLETYASNHRYRLLRVNMKGGGIGSGTLVVRAGWIPRELVFTARGSGPFRLAYGNARADASALSADALVPALQGDRKSEIPVVTTGAPQKLAGEAATLPRADARKWGLWAALLAGVALLAWMAWRLLAQMQKSEGN
jgi:hypothetical protein